MDFVKKAVSSATGKKEEKPTDNNAQQNDDYVDKGECCIVFSRNVDFSLTSLYFSLRRWCQEVWLQHRPQHAGEDHRRCPLGLREGHWVSDTPNFLGLYIC